ncbi:MAG: hypothetical protein WCD35_12135 [Mycobacteriales bacterium]
MRRATWAARSTQLDRPAVAAAAAAVLVGAFVVLRLLLAGGGLSGFVLAGDASSDARRVPAELHVRHDGGYDGQFVYRIALDPLTHEQVAHGIALDAPSYRQGRIATSALAWAVHTATRMPTTGALLLVNALALVAAAGFGARLLHDLGGHSLWGVLLALSLGTVIPLARDLTEPVSWAAVLAGLSWVVRKQWAAAGAAFVVAVLARETALLVPAAVGLTVLATAVRTRQWRPALAPAAAMLLPLAALAAWQAHLRTVWGTAPYQGGTHNVGTPFLGVLQSLLGRLHDTSSHAPLLNQTAWTVERWTLVVLLVTAALAWRRSGLPAALPLAWVLATGLALSLGAWSYDAQFLRVVNDAIGLSVLVLVLQRTRASRTVLALVAAVSAGVALMYVAAP